MARKRIAPTRNRKVGAPVVSKIRRTKTQVYTEDWDAITRRVKKRDNNRCTDCGSTKKLQVHHIIPASKGGRTIDYNLKTLCEDCHEKRHHHMR